MTSGQALVVGIGLALILVIAVAVAAFVWREHVVDRRRGPEERYRRAVADVRQVRTDLKRDSDRRRARQSDPPDCGASGGAGVAF
jgi:Flp pilus assembly protein TadB